MSQLSPFEQQQLELHQALQAQREQVFALHGHPEDMAPVLEIPTLEEHIQGILDFHAEEAVSPVEAVAPEPEKPAKRTGKKK